MGTSVGLVYALSHNGSVLPGWPVQMGEVQARSSMPVQPSHWSQKHRLSGVLVGSTACEHSSPLSSLEPKLEPVTSSMKSKLLSIPWTQGIESEQRLHCF